ncbi:Rab1a [Hexamita inflata]|uniref:Rab1a n=1 Tax=Hexamita inflata TaxID=28002 RepID=A0AA86UFV6_9EUKA|nr:Rab1a [Hexamita inflata]
MSNIGKEMRLVMLGESSVGKTSLLYRYMSDCFYENPASTITASFYKKKIIDQNIPTNLQLWDTAGQEKFQSITPLYYRNADIIFIVFSVDSTISFEKAMHTIEEVRSHKNQPNIILLGNKLDLENEVKEQAESFQAITCYPLFWVSALSGSGVQEAFQQAIQDANRKHVDIKRQKKLVKEIDEKMSKKWCC